MVPSACRPRTACRARTACSWCRSCDGAVGLRAADSLVGQVTASIAGCLQWCPACWLRTAGRSPTTDDLPGAAMGPSAFGPRTVEASRGPPQHTATLRWCRQFAGRRQPNLRKPDRRGQRAAMGPSAAGRGQKGGSVGLPVWVWLRSGRRPAGRGQRSGREALRAWAARLRWCRRPAGRGQQQAPPGRRAACARGCDGADGLRTADNHRPPPPRHHHLHAAMEPSACGPQTDAVATVNAVIGAGPRWGRHPANRRVHAVGH